MRIRALQRIEVAKESGAPMRFLSLEPMLAPMPNIPLDGIGQVIAGGESGPGCREVKEEWLIDVRDQCARAGVPFFFKQWSSEVRGAKGNILQGKAHQELAWR
jgi:protein gp37